MATYYQTLPNSQYRLRLDVTSSPNVALNTTTFSWASFIEKTSGSGYWTSGAVSWAVDSPAGVQRGTGGGAGYDFRSYSVLALGVGSFTVAGSAARQFVFGWYDAAGGPLGNGTLTTTFTPAVIPAVPSTPTVVRVSDSQHTVSWSNPGPAYTSVAVQRRLNGGAATGVGSASGNATSFTDTTTLPDSMYEYRVAGNAAAGQSAFSAWSAPVFTTPAAPVGVSAEKVSTSLIRVSASGVPPHATSYDIEDNGTVIATSVALPWDHASPNPAVTHTYRVRGKVGSLVGPFSAVSNTVQLQAPPNAATNLTPNGAVVNVADPLTLGWRHNPVDSSAQSQYQIRVRPSGGAWVEKAAVTSGSESVSVTPASFFGAAGLYEWQVRTRGADPAFGPYSATATVELIQAPAAAISSPSDPWNASIVDAVWTYSQAQGKPQSAWQAELRDADQTVLESLSGSGGATSASFSHRVTDGDGFDVRVRVAASGVWSPWVTQAFDAAFLLPAQPSISGVWRDQYGDVFLTIDPSTPGVGEAATESLIVERNIGSGWERVGVFSPQFTEFSDHESLSMGTTQYRVTAVTAEGADRSDVVDVVAASETVWLNGGTGFSLAARLPFNPTIEVVAGRPKSLRQYLGSAVPNAFAAPYTHYGLSVSGMTKDVSDYEVTASMRDLETLALHRSPLFMHRDPDGRRVYGTISEIPQPRMNGLGYWGYSYQMTRTRR